MSSNNRPLDGDIRKRFCKVVIEVFWDRVLHINRVLVRRQSWNSHSLVTLGRHSAWSLFSPSGIHWEGYTWEMSWNGRPVSGNTWGRDSAHSLLRSLRARVLQVRRVILGRCLEIAFHLVWHFDKRLCMVTVKVSQKRALPIWLSYTWKMVLKWQFISDTREDTLQILNSGFPDQRDLQGGIVLLTRCSWNGHSLMTLGKRLHVHCSGLLRYRIQSQ